MRRSTRARGYAWAAARARAEVQGAPEEPLSIDHEELAAIHPSWYTPPPPSPNPEAARWLERRAYGHLVAMRGAAPDALSRQEPAAIEEIIVQLGQGRLALALAGVAPAALAQLCAQLGEPTASQLVAAVRAIKKEAARDAVKRAQRSLVALGQGGELLFHAGARLLGAALAEEGDELLRVAQRLPRPLGESLLAEARAVDDAETRAEARAALARLA